MAKEIIFQVIDAVKGNLKDSQQEILLLVAYLGVTKRYGEAI